MFSNKTLQGRTVAQWLGLLPHREKVLGPLCAEFWSLCGAHSPRFPWVLSEYSGFPPWSKNMLHWLVGDSKLPLGVIE